MPEAISPRTAHLLKEITGETHLEGAVLTTVADALEHRLERVEEALQEMEARYGMPWAKFKEAWDRGETANRHSFQVEQDYWRWEELVTRQGRLQDAMTWLR